jgi:hypothetical protein
VIGLSGCQEKKGRWRGKRFRAVVGGGQAGEVRKRVIVSVVVCAVVAGGVVVWAMGGAWLRGVVAGEGFRRMLSREVSKSIKVEGEFQPMRLEEGWTVATGGFASTGWPGEAIGVLDAEGVRARFAPTGVLRRLWEVDLLTIERGRFVLREHDDALKRHPVAGKPPWYAVVMPTRFFCRWIECPRAEVEFPFAGGRGVLGDVRIGALMVGRNFKYYIEGGRLDFPLLPVMDVDALEIYVTREEVDIGYAWLREAGGPGTLFLRGRIGQRGDKGIDAEAGFEALPIERLLPEGLRGRLDGRLGGNLTYGSDRSGGNPASAGEVRLAGGVLRDWGDAGKFERLVDPRVFEDLAFRDFGFRYDLRDGVFRVEDLVCEVDGLLRLDGGVVYREDGRTVGFDAAIGGVVLGDWLEAGLRERLGGTLGGEVRWTGSAANLLKGTGGGTLRLDGGWLRGFRFQDFLCRFLKDDGYGNLALAEASLDWEADGGGVVVRKIDVVAKGLAGLRGGVRVDADGGLGGEVLVGLPASSLEWLPRARETVFARQEDGLWWATVTLGGTIHEPRNDFTRQVMAELRKHPLAMAGLAARGLSWWLGDMMRKPAGQ